MADTFIESNRTFAELSPKTDYSNWHDSRISELLGINNNLRWEDLLKTDDICIILGEVGSGKSIEFKNQYLKLTDQGINAFYIELENLIDKNDSSILNPKNVVTFNEWRHKRGIAYFFLDSIDESKFTDRSDFKKAVRNFIYLVGISNLERCRIFFSSRFSEWHPRSDLILIEELIPEHETNRIKSEGTNSVLNF